MLMNWHMPTQNCYKLSGTVMVKCRRTPEWIPPNGGLFNWWTSCVQKTNPYIIFREIVFFCGGDGGECLFVCFIFRLQYLGGIYSTHSRLIPMYNARFILWPPSLSSPFRKKLVNGQMPEMRSQPLKQSMCLAAQSQLGQSIATNHEIRIKKFQNFTSILR